MNPRLPGEPLRVYRTRWMREKRGYKPRIYLPCPACTSPSTNVSAHDKVAGMLIVYRKCPTCLHRFKEVRI